MAGDLLRRIGIELFVVAVAGAVLGAFGPFGTFAMPAGLRLSYWIGFLIAGYAVFRPLIRIGEWLADAFDLPRWLGTGLALSLGAVPVALMVQLALSGFDRAAAVGRDDFALIYAEVLLIGVLVNGLFHLLYRRAVEPAPAEPRDASDAVMAADEPEPRFARRLPPGFGPLLALAGEDHYVRAIAEGREELVLVRLRDAVVELAGEDGMQVHRSWWVAREAVREVRREGRTLTLVLANGRAVPVARDKVALLRQAGWL